MIEWIHFGSNCLSVATSNALQFALGRLRKPIGKILDDIEAARDSRRAA